MIKFQNNNQYNNYQIMKNQKIKNANNKFHHLNKIQY